MKRASIFPILLIFFCSVSFFSCVTNENPPEEYVIWKPALSFQKGLTHAKEINGKLYAASETGIYNDATLWSINNFNDLSRFLPEEIVYRLPISETLMATIKNDEIILMPAGRPFEEDALVIKMREFDPLFGSFGQVYFRYGDQIGINQNGHVLVPYQAPIIFGETKYTPNFLWLKTAVKNGKVEILEQKLIKEEFFDDWVSIWNFKVFENFMRVTIGNKTFDFDQSGNMEVRFEYYTKSVQVGDDIITFASEAMETFPLMVYKSDLSGKKPELVGTYNSDQVSKDDRRLLGRIYDNISGINDTIVLFEGTSIYRLSMNDQAIRLTRLDNIGLEETFITSISLLYNSTVFVTSTCSGSQGICGGFYKPLDKFFASKK
ncbi:hypothetical protein [Aquiflexum balticum]|nr:hypothetical protein [Aquiflexum balticum]